MRRIAACGWMLWAPVFSALAQPVLEYAPEPGGPWTPDTTAQVVETAPGRYEATTTPAAAARLYRVTDDASVHCILSIARSGESVTVAFAAPTAETDGDGVLDCEDLCQGRDDRVDGDGDGVPDGCDICTGYTDRIDADGDGVPDGCDVCPGRDDRIDENGNEAPDCTELPANLALIPGGESQMGNTFTGEGDPDENPVHAVFVSGFYMDKHEVTKALWDDVSGWAVARGYSFDNAGAGKAPNHPVHTVSWYDVVKWCNARSEKEGLTPCYYTSAGHWDWTVYRAGQVSVTSAWVKWAASGYRLPTEAEWEMAARGGRTGKRFPWGDAIIHSQANYYSSASYSYDVSPTRGYHPEHDTGGHPYTSPVGSFAPNAYGLYDMAGNLWEWCWDRYSSSWYGRTEARNPDPRGPSWGPYRVYRGGGWGDGPVYLRGADRQSASPGSRFNSLGFRCARGRL